MFRFAKAGAASARIDEDSGVLLKSDGNRIESNELRDILLPTVGWDPSGPRDRLTAHK